MAPRVIYRSLHGAPMLAGVPVHYALALLGTASVAGFGVMSLTTVGGLLVVGSALLVWACLAVVFRKDRVAVPLFLLRLRFRFPASIASYTRSYCRVHVKED